MSRSRSLARRRAVQALYVWQMTEQDLADIDEQFVIEQDMKNVDLDYFKELLHKVPANLTAIDEKLEPVLDRPFAEIDPIEKAVMRIGVYELEYRIDIPYKVVINEAVQLAKTFGADQSHKYVNGILDNIAKNSRAEEIAFKAKQTKTKATPK